jgi:hypothetical protein
VRIPARWLKVYAINNCICWQLKWKKYHGLPPLVVEFLHPGAETYRKPCVHVQMDYNLACNAKWQQIIGMYMIQHNEFYLSFISG